MRKQIYILLSALFFTSYGYSQADNWYFGVNAGIDFSGTTPVVLNDGILVTNEVKEGCLPTIINEQRQSRLKIYPNPFEEHLNLYSPGGLLIIYDLSGRIVFEKILHEGMQTIRPMINSGFYLLKICTRDQIFLSRITKESY